MIVRFKQKFLKIKVIMFVITKVNKVMNVKNNWIIDILVKVYIILIMLMRIFIVHIFIRK